MPPQGARYKWFLQELHRAHVFDWYLEIGCRSGDTFAPSRSATIAVDPYFRVEQNAIGPKPALHVFQMTSDAFFATGFLARNGIALSLSFIDGMHLIENVLRDLIQIERNSAPQARIMLHDCCPKSHRMTTRDLADLPSGPWTGDVWKIYPILRRWRPDLVLTTLDLRPSGLLVLSGLDPGNDVLERNAAAILAEFQELELADFGLAEFNALFTYSDARAEVAAGFPLFAPAATGRGLAPTYVSP